jgi:hypothetical protein
MRHRSSSCKRCPACNNDGISRENDRRIFNLDLKSMAVLLVATGTCRAIDDSRHAHTAMHSARRSRGDGGSNASDERVHGLRQCQWL